MANIIKRTNEGTSAVDLDPVRVMREMLRWDPFREMAPMFGGVERNTFMPHFDVTENKDSYLFKADLPGVKEGDIDITLNGRQLTIAQWLAYVAGYDFGPVAPSRLVLHHTFVPTRRIVAMSFCEPRS